MSRRPTAASRIAASCVVAALALGGLGAPPARAQSADATVAEAAFQRGRDLLAAHKYAEACDAFAESNRAQRATGTLLNIAICSEGMGRLATAWSTYRTVESESLATSPPRLDRAKTAHDRAAALEPRLSRVRIEVESKSPGLEVSVDGVVVGPVMWAAGTVVDPGTHAVRAAAGGFVPWEGKTDVRGEGRTEVVKIPALEPAPKPDPAPPPSPSPAPPAATRPVPPPGASPSRAPGWILVGGGAVVAAAGLVVGVLALDRAHAARQCAGCVRGSSDASRADKAYDQAVVFADVSDVLVPLGLVGAAIGTILLLSQPASRDASTASAPGTVRW